MGISPKRGSTQAAEGNYRSVADLFDASLIEASDANASVPQWVHILSCGSWKTLTHGSFQVTERDMDEMVKNFSDGVRKGVPIDAEHDITGGAYAWIEGLQRRGAQLWAKFDWNSKGASAVSDKVYRFFSPEFAPKYRDPETGKSYSNVLLGGAITNRPLFKNLTPIMASEGSGATLYLSEDSTMEDETKPVETPEEAVETPAPEPVAEPEEEKTVEASETVTITAAEKARFDEMSKKFSEMEKREAEAKEELRKKTVSDQVAGWMFSEGNENGKFAPTVKDDMTAFVLSLSEDQKADFAKLVEKMPKATTLFGEKGFGTSEEAIDGDKDEKVAGVYSLKGDAALKMSEKAELYMKEHGGSYGRALTEVRRANPVLASEMDEENKAVPVKGRVG